MKQKRILIVHHAAEYGGGSKGALLIGRMLRDLGYLVKYFIPDYSLDFQRILLEEGFEIDLYQGRMGGVFNYIGGPKKVSRTFIKNLLKITHTKHNMKEVFQSNYDFVIVNSSVMCWMGKYLSGKSICFIRENVPVGFWKFYERYKLKQFDRLFFISEFDKENWGNPENGVIIRDCVLKTDSSIKELKKIKRILYLGGDNEIKGWGLVKKIMNEMRDYDFIIAGYVKETEKINEPHIHYYGMVNNIQHLYDMADLVILPSIVPHQLMPIYEAALYGKVVIATDFQLIREHIQHNYNGILVPLGDVEALSNAIRELSNNLSKCNELIFNNYEKMQVHKYEVVKEELYKTIESL